MSKTNLYCCGCQKEVKPRLTNGEEIYPHRPDLRDLPFWKCDECGNYVGTHYKTKEPTKPFGCIPTPEIRRARKQIHDALDPLWKSGKISRGSLYKKLSQRLGYSYHSGDVSSVEQANRILNVVEGLFP